MAARNLKYAGSRASGGESKQELTGKPQALGISSACTQNEANNPADTWFLRDRKF